MALAVAMVAVLGACSNSADSSPKKTTAAEQLAAAKTKVDAATSMPLTLRSSGLPATFTGPLASDGSRTHPTSFTGTLTARLSGSESQINGVAIDKLLYVKLPFTTDFAQVDPKTYNAPDPAQLFATEGGITSLMTATVNPVEGKKVRVGPDVLQTITGTLPGASVAKLLNIGDATKTFDVTYGLTDPGGELRTVVMTGPFYQGATSTYTLTLDKYGATVAISKP